MTKTSLIISYYKALDNLKLILDALNNQSDQNFEAIISEDDNNKETISFLKQNLKNYSYPIKHTNQELDNGFRKNIMLNKSIKIATGETIVFIDGDCIPHKHFIRAYNKNTVDGYMLKGRRVMLCEQLSKKLKDTKNLKFLKIGSIIKSNSKKKKEAICTNNISLIISMKGKGLLGCNWGIKKKHLVEINGFDEDYVKAAVGEDTDIEWRLKAINIKNKSMKNKAIVYHLFHKTGYSKDDVQHNNVILAEKIKANNYVCINGIEKL
jgi:glycosyltransferase involved in cell wall biosynthesis